MDEEIPLLHYAGRSLEGFVRFAGAASLMSYGYTFATASELLAPLGISVEEIGIDPAWIALRTLIVAWPVFLYLLLIYLAVVRCKESRSLFRGCLWFLLVIVIPVLGLVAFDVYLATSPHIVRYPDYIYALRIVLVILLCAFPASILASTRAPAHVRAWIAGAVGLLLVIATFVTGFRTAREEGFTLSRGGSGPYESFGLPLFHEELVSVYHDGSPLVPLFPRAIFLGAHDGYMVLLVGDENRPQQVWRLPVDSTTIRASR